jgi:multidrug efflux system outer membrane protein
VPATYRLDTPETSAAVDVEWWSGFDDPVLDDLVRVALRNNRDVRIASARIEEFEARLAGARAGLFPAVGYNANLARQKVTEVGPQPLPPGVDPQRSSASAVASASWELDLWGRIRRADEAARADLLATREARSGVVLSLVAEVARSYIQLLNLDAQIDITRRTLELRAKAVDVFEQRFAGGVISELEVRQMRAEYEAAAARLPDLEQALAQQENALSVLLGANPGPVVRGRGLRQLALPAVPGGLPSSLLQRRPDVRKAEQDLIAANARIGAARARYFPALTLTGTLGSSSAALSNLFSGPASVWSFGGALAGPIFDAGLIGSNVRQAEAQRTQLLLSYEKTVQQAFREVNDALVGHLRIRERAEAQSRQVAELERYAELAQARYEGGYSSYLEALDAERGLFNGLLAEAQARADVVNNLVALYRAMGGGWVSLAEGIAYAPGAAATGAAAVDR